MTRVKTGQPQWLHFAAGTISDYLYNDIIITAFVVVSYIVHVVSRDCGDEIRIKHGYPLFENGCASVRRCWTTLICWRNANNKRRTRRCNWAAYLRWSRSFRSIFLSRVLTTPRHVQLYNYIKIAWVTCHRQSVYLLNTIRNTTPMPCNVNSVLRNFFPTRYEWCDAARTRGVIWSCV